MTKASGTLHHTEFYNTSLTSIIFPKNLKSIGKSSFSHVPLTSITIPSSVTSIGNEAFFDCGSLNSITVEEGNKTYDSRGNCNALIRTSSNTLLLGCSSTVIPDGVTSIVEYAFKVCSGLTSIHIPKSVTSIQYSSFVGCIDLSCISVAEDNPKYDSRDNCNGIIETASDKFLLGCKNSVIPKDVKSIGEQAFFFCRGLTSIILPEGVTSVGQDAFNCCKELETITIPRSLKTFNYASFYDCSGLKAVHISDLSAWCKINFFDNSSNPLTFAHHLFLNGEELKELVIPDGITPTEKSFMGCSGLTSLTIPSGVKWIDPGTFSNCSGLKSVIFQEGITSIGHSAFSGCSSLTSLAIPEGVKTLNEFAFQNCSSLESLSIPSTVTIIRYGCFSGCPRLTTVTSFIQEPFDIDKSVFNSSYSSATLYVPKGTKEKYQSRNGWKEFRKIVEFGDDTVIVGAPVQDTGSSLSEQYYSPDGHQLQAPAKGLNIIRRSDGSVKKVLQR